MDNRPADDIVLKPCPFCGSRARVSQATRPESVGRWTWRVQCCECNGTVLYFDSRENAVEAWNRRSESDTSEVFGMTGERQARLNYRNELYEALGGPGCCLCGGDWRAPNNCMNAFHRWAGAPEKKL